MFVSLLPRFYGDIFFAPPEILKLSIFGDAAEIQWRAERVPTDQFLFFGRVGSYEVRTHVKTEQKRTRLRQIDLG